MSHAAEAVVCADECVQGHTPVKGESDGESQGIQGEKASSHPMLLNEPLGRAIMNS